jgi:hypothetical protein
MWSREAEAVGKFEQAAAGEELAGVGQVDGDGDVRLVGVRIRHVVLPSNRGKLDPFLLPVDNRGNEIVALFAVKLRRQSNGNLRYCSKWRRGA